MGQNAKKNIKTQDFISIHRATENNLKSISVQIPKNKITVITGLSGSGKSSLAFDTLYSEGQRRYIESLSTYAKQFVGGYKKPNVEKIEGLSPSIAIDQRTITPNPRSTVGTLTEAYDYLRLLMARVGTPYCPNHHIPVSGQTHKDILNQILKFKLKEKFYVFAPVARSKKGEFTKEVQNWIKKGYIKAIIDGQWVELHKVKKLSKTKPHNIDLLIDRLVNEEKFIPRIQESLLRALELTQGYLDIEILNGERFSFSTLNACPKCNYSFPKIEPRIFSFNHPQGACSACDGLGAIEYETEYELETGDLETEYSWEACTQCQGARLKEESLNIFLENKNIFKWSSLPLNQLEPELKKISWSKNQKLIANEILPPLFQRIQYMNDVGCGYLQLSRPTKTLSGGEAQRVRLATQLGSEMIGILYVLDEPSIGLHPKDHLRLLKVVKDIKERGNTVVMVEHDEETILQADYIIDIGPGAGRLGGEILAEGSLKEFVKNSKSITAPYLNHKKRIFTPKEKRKTSGQYIEIKNAHGHNLNHLDVKIPLQVFVGVTGASGSGKSTLIHQTLMRKVLENLGLNTLPPAPHDEITGLNHVDKVIEINQRPIGKNPRSIPVTYVGVYTSIRQLMSQIPESKMRGYKPSHFSFNVKAGRCEHCQGAGLIKMEMHFMSNVYVNCDHCQGKRYSPEILSVKFRDKNIYDILSMTVDEAYDFFKNHKLISEKLKTLIEVGLGYITLGQSSTTLSGGEAQRIKLAKELSKRSTGKTLYILDEPTTGLHFADIDKLLRLLHQLVDQGNSLIVIEHNMDVIRNCDHIIDLGPEGGIHGGQIMAEGPPEKIRKEKKSFTGRFL